MEKEEGGNLVRTRLTVVLAASFVLIGLIGYWWYRGGWMAGCNPSPDSPIAIATYANDTGTQKGSLYVEGVNVVVRDNTIGNVSSLTTPKGAFTIQFLAGHTYHVNATLGTSAESKDVNYIGVDGQLWIRVWDNRTISSVNYTPVVC